MYCENCNEYHDGSFGSGRFCCSKCARSYSTKLSKNKTKIVKCINCNADIITGLRSSNNLLCEICKIKNLEKRKCIICGSIFYCPKKYIKEHCSQKCVGANKILKENRRIHAIKNKLGGHTSKQSIYYKMRNGKYVYLQSSYEVKIAKILDEKNIFWIRPEPFFWFDSNNIKHRYYPDFYLPKQDIYLDPKNDYLAIKDKYKIQQVSIQNNINILIIGKENLNWSYLSKIL